MANATNAIINFITFSMALPMYWSNIYKWRMFGKILAANITEKTILS